MGADGKVISSDSHLVEPPDLWTSRGSAEFADRIPHVVEEESGPWWYFGSDRAVPLMVTGRTGQRFAKAGERQVNHQRPGGNNPDERLKDLAIDGVAAEVLYPTIGMYAFRWLPDSRLVDEMCRSYNDFASEFCSAHPNSFKAAAMINVDDVDEATREVERAAPLGLVAALIPVDPGGGLSYDDPVYEPLWAALSSNRIAVAFHLLTNRERLMSRVGEFATFNGPADTCTQSFHVQRSIAAMILAGVFERNPALSVIAVEFEASWAASFMEIMDEKYKFAHSMGSTVWHRFGKGALPSDFFRQNVFLTFQEDALAIRIRDEIGADRLMWGSDFPHNSGTFPKSRPIIDELFAKAPEEQRDAMVRGNAAKLFGFAL